MDIDNIKDESRGWGEEGVRVLLGKRLAVGYSMFGDVVGRYG